MEVFVFDWWWTSHQSPAHKSLRILRFCIVSWKDEREPTIKLCMGRQIDVVQKDKIDGEPMEFEWNICPGLQHVAAQPQSSRVTVRMSVTPEKFTGRIIFMSMFDGISWRSKDNEKECNSNAQLVSLFAKRFGAGQWSFLGPGPEKKWYSISEDSPQGEWDKIAEKMMVTLARTPSLPSHESIVQRSA